MKTCEVCATAFQSGYRGYCSIDCNLKQLFKLERESGSHTKLLALLA